MDDLLELWTVRPTCPRCRVGSEFFFDDGRCSFCGMTPETEGPPPIRELRGVTFNPEYIDRGSNRAARRRKARESRGK